MWMTSCTGSAHGGFWKRQLVELRTGHRTRRVDFRLLAEALGRCRTRWWGQKEEEEKQFNSKKKKGRKKKKKKQEEKKKRRQAENEKKWLQPTKSRKKRHERKRKSKKKVFAHCITLSLWCQLIFGFVKKEFKLIIMVKAWVLMTRAFLEG